MKPFVIIQARMNSRRLPGKVLKKISGKTVLEHVVERVSYCKLINGVGVATSNDSLDEPIIELCKENGILYFRGSQLDVLDRYQKASKFFNTESIVRITADCPVIDPLIIDTLITSFLAGKYDYFYLSGGFPDGLDTSIISYSCLKRASELAELKSEREHVVPFIEKNSAIFNIGKLEIFKDLSRFRWTLDEEQDLKFLTKIYKRLYKDGSIFYTNDILDLLDKEPKLLKINNMITRNEGYLKSIADDLNSQ